MLREEQPQIWKVGFDYPTLRKEREGWGTRRLVAGIEPKACYSTLNWLFGERGTRVDLWAPQQD